MDRDDDLRVISRFVDVLRFPPFAASRREIAAGSLPPVTRSRLADEDVLI